MKCIYVHVSATETAQAFWATLLPHGLRGGALTHVHSTDDDDDDDMGEGGWKDEYVQWWFDFLAEKGGKGISKDTWVMVSRFCRLVIILYLTTPSSRNLCAQSTPNSKIMTWKVSSTQPRLNLGIRL